MLLSPDKEAEAKKAYFKTIDLKLTGIVKQVIQTNEHGYGVIYLQKVSSNKDENYVSKYLEKYLYCKIGKNEAIIVTGGSHQLQQNDSISINTQQQQYLVYRKGNLILNGNPWISTEEGFYSSMAINGYLDFTYYKR